MIVTIIINSRAIYKLPFVITVIKTEFRKNEREKKGKQIVGVNLWSYHMTCVFAMTK